MDFFGAQERSQRNTRWLLLWFLPAVLALFIGMHLILVLVFRAIPFDLTDDFQALIDTEGTHAHSLSYLFRHPRVILASQIPVLLILLFTIGRKWRALSLGGGKMLLEKIGARRLSAFSNPQEKQLLNVVSEMAIASGLPAPMTFVLDGVENINALCAGFTAEEAVIGVTKGALEKLSRDELQGLVAHEFGHISSGDLTLSMRLSCLLDGFTQIGILGLNLTFFSFVLLIPAALLDPNNPHGLATWFIALTLLAILVGMLILIVGGIGMIMGTAAQRAISREREFLADAAAVQFSRLSDGLAGVLQKARREIKQGQAEKFRSSSVRHMLFQDAVPGWLATHPPIEERLARLGQVKRLSMPGGTIRPAATTEARTFPDLFGTAIDAKAAVYAVLMLEHGGETEPLIQMLAGYDAPDVALKAEELMALLSGADQKGAQSIVTQAVPALKRLNLDQRTRFLRATEILMTGDGDISPLEEALIQTLRNELMPVRGKASADEESINRALVLVASAMAHVGQNLESEADRAFESIQEHLPTMRCSKRRAFETIKHWEFAASLDVLNSADDATKQNFMRGLKACAMQDGVISEKEEIVLSAVSQAIGVAVPETVYVGPWI